MVKITNQVQYLSVKNMSFIEAKSTDGIFDQSWYWIPKYASMCLCKFVVCLWWLIKQKNNVEIPGAVCVCEQSIYLSIYIYIHTYIHTYRCVHKGKHNKTHGQSKGKEHKLVCNGIDITWAVNIIKCGDQQFLTWQIQTGWYPIVHPWENDVATLTGKPHPNSLFV